MNDNLRRVIYRTYPPHFNRSLVFSLHLAYGSLIIGYSHKRQGITTDNALVDAFDVCHHHTHFTFPLSFNNWVWFKSTFLQINRIESFLYKPANT